MDGKAASGLKGLGGKGRLDNKKVHRETGGRG